MLITANLPSLFVLVTISMCCYEWFICVVKYIINTIICYFKDKIFILRLSFIFSVICFVD